MPESMGELLLQDIPVRFSHKHRSVHPAYPGSQECSYLWQEYPLLQLPQGSGQILQDQMPEKGLLRLHRKQKSNVRRYSHP